MTSQSTITMNKANKTVRPPAPATRASASGSSGTNAREREHTGAVEERMYQDIYDAIMEHRLPPRTKLNEQTLCQIYDTARHTVRKVLSRLASEGMVDLEANRGAFIASPSHAEVRDMFELRNILEHAVLEKVGQILAANARSGDFAFRHGGEEFLLVCVEQTAAEAMERAEKIRQDIAAQSLQVPNAGPLSVTVSIGIAAHDGHPDYQRLIERADKALYDAKNGGRNRAVLAA